MKSYNMFKPKHMKQIITKTRSRATSHIYINIIKVLYEAC